MKKVITIFFFLALICKGGWSQILPEYQTIEDSMFHNTSSLQKYKLDNSLAKLFVAKINLLKVLALKSSQNGLFYNGNEYETYRFPDNMQPNCNEGKLECTEFQLDTLTSSMRIRATQCRYTDPEKNTREYILGFSFEFTHDLKSNDYFIIGNFSLIQYHIDRSFPPRITYMKLCEYINELEENLSILNDQKLSKKIEANRKLQAQKPRYVISDGIK